MHGGLKTTSYAVPTHLRPRVCVQTSLHGTAPRPFAVRPAHRDAEMNGGGLSSTPPERSEFRAAPAERDAGQGASREQGRARLAGGFLSPVPFRVLLRFFLWTVKERNEVPQWNPLEKENHGWNANGFLFRMRDNGKIRKISPLFPVLFYLEPCIPQNTTGRDNAQFLPSKPARRLRAIRMPMRRASSSLSRP